jgi:hypothetical protein
LASRTRPGRAADDEPGPAHADGDSQNLELKKQTDRLRGARKTASKDQPPDASARPDSKKSKKKNLSEELFEKPLF